MSQNSPQIGQRYSNKESVIEIISIDSIETYVMILIPFKKSGSPPKGTFGYLSFYHFPYWKLLPNQNKPL